jgi:amino acid adenylation domain-containing protein
MSNPSDDQRPLARRLQALSPERRAIVERLLRERQGRQADTLAPKPTGLFAPTPTRSEGGVLPRPDRDGLLAVSFGQQRLWFMAQLDPTNSVYNTVSSVSLVTPVDLKALQRAVDALVARHESLRTTFEAVDGEPFQRIHTHALIAVQVGQPTPEFVRRPFDLEHGPLARVCVNVDSGQVVACVHHIITDGWSMGIFLRELSLLYTAGRTGKAVALAQLPIQYADFAIWQRTELAGNRLSELLNFWRAELTDLPLLDLVTDRPRPPVPSFQGGTVPVQISPEVVTRLRGLAQEQGATLFMVALAGFSVLLSRYSGQDEVVIGSPVAGRTRSNTEGLIGFFVNTIVLRCDLRGDPTFREVLTRTRDRAVRAYAHQDLPFEKLVEQLHPDRDASRNPLHQVVLHLVDSSSGEVRVESDPKTQIRTGTTFDLVVYLRGAGADLKGDIEYSSELFDRSTVEQLAGHLAMLLATLVDNPDHPLSRIQMLTPHERRQLEDFDGTAMTCPSGCVAGLIEAQAARTPEALAVGTVTYRELAHAANGVAHHLLTCGAGPDKLVAVSLPRGSDLVVALLGIWKAGAGYLPLDPDDPPTRRQQILADARPLLVLDDPTRFGPSRPDAPPASKDPRRIAYAIYTSGSTGTPKGVLIEHASLVNLIAWHVRQYGITAKDRATLIANPAFDASVWELWPYLAAGASVHVLPSATRSPVGILEWLAAERITLTFLPTPLAEAVLIEPMPPHLALRYLLTGGDRLHRAPERQLPFDLVNHYGPTEATVVATAGFVRPDRDESAPPIGRPIDNVRVLVVDQYGQPLPVGIPGELWVSGAGLARGYLRRPELTVERFIQRGTQRMYRTSDRVRRRADGALDFLGRLDQQVKIRGFRIEPGEIESQLRAHPSVRATVVVAHRDRLIAYVVLSSPGDRIDSLRTHLQARLPSYMVPARFEILEALPLTANGKIDERALPPPVDDDSGQVAPRTPAERTIAGIFITLLGRERVGVYDDFFELGGHSLLATQLVSRIRSTLGIELSVGAVFGTPTVAGLAAALAKSPPADASAAHSIACAPRHRYRARIAADGALVLDQSLRELLHLDD